MYYIQPIGLTSIGCVSWSNPLARRAGNQGARPAIAQYAEDNSGTEPNTIIYKNKKDYKKDKEQDMFNCKKSNIISTYNTRTLSSKCQINKCVNAAIETKQDIICIQEHRHHHPDVPLINDEVGYRWLFVSASCWKNSQLLP